MRYVKTITGRYQQVTNEQLRAMRSIPKNSTPIEEDGIGVVYVSQYPHRPGYYQAVGFVGNAAKCAFNYLYKTDAEVDRKIESFFTALREHKARVAASRKADFDGHNFVVGDIVTNSWGYDQTNVDWYRVSRTTKAYVWLVPVQSTCEQTGFMSGDERLVLDENLKPVDAKDAKETKHRASKDRVNMKYGSGSKHVGGVEHSSWYA